MPEAKRGCLFGIAHVVSLYALFMPPERHIALAGIKEPPKYHHP